MVIGVCLVKCTLSLLPVVLCFRGKGGGAEVRHGDRRYHACTQRPLQRGQEAGRVRMELMIGFLCRFIEAVSEKTNKRRKDSTQKD